MLSSLPVRMRFGLLPFLALTLTALEMHADIDITAMERLPTKTGKSQKGERTFVRSFVQKGGGFAQKVANLSRWAVTMC